MPRGYPDYHRPVDIARQTLDRLFSNIDIKAQSVSLELITQWQAKEIEDFIIAYDSGSLAGGAVDYVDTVVPAGEVWYITGFNFGSHMSGPYRDGGYFITHYEAGVGPLLQSLPGKEFQQHTLPKPYRVPEGNTIRTGVYNPTVDTGRYVIHVFGYKLAAASMPPSDPSKIDLTSYRQVIAARGINVISYERKGIITRVIIVNGIIQKRLDFEVKNLGKTSEQARLLRITPVKFR